MTVLLLRLILIDEVLKAAVLQMLKNKKNKLTLNTDQVMFSGEIYYY